MFSQGYIVWHWEAAVSTAGEEFISILAENVEELSKELPKLDILD